MWPAVVAAKVPLKIALQALLWCWKKQFGMFEAARMGLTKRITVSFLMQKVPS